MAQSISDDTPNGFCKKCGFHLQNTKGKQKICVNCDIQGDQPTDERNEFADPGHKAVMAALGSVVPAKERVNMKQPVDSDPQVPAVDEGAKQYVEKPKNVETNSKAGIRPEYAYGVPGALELIKDHFAALPVSDLKQAKTLLKLRKEIEELSNKITNFLGGN